MATNPWSSHKILIIEGSGSGKTNSLFNPINEESDIDKINLYAKDPFEAKYQFLIKKRESTGLKHFNDSNAFMEYLNDIDDIYKNIEEYNPNKKCKILIVFDDMIAGMLGNKKLNPIVTELFIRGRKLKRFFKTFKRKIFFDQFVNEWKFEISKSSELNDFNNFSYYTGKSVPKYFVRFKGPLIMYNDIKNGWISLQKEKKIQEEFQSELKEILKQSPNQKIK